MGRRVAFAVNVLLGRNDAHFSFWQATGEVIGSGGSRGHAAYLGGVSEGVDGGQHIKSSVRSVVLNR